jgi:plastocyanin
MNAPTRHRLHAAVIIDLLRTAAILALLCALAVLTQPGMHAARSDTGPHTWHVTVAIDSPDRSIVDHAFLPGDLYIDVGDTVVWTTRSEDIHSVTFLPPGSRAPLFSPFDDTATQQGSTRYDGASYYNSGTMAASQRPIFVIPVVTTYGLTFNKQGTFPYLCVMYHRMQGRIHVRPAGTPYPFTQAQYDASVAQQVAAAMRVGHALAAQAARESSSHNVTAGIGNGEISVIRFFPSHSVVHVGDTVTFTNRDAIMPHVITFGGREGDPSIREGDPMHYDGTAPLQSGFLSKTPMYPPDVATDYGTAFKVRFVKAGHFEVICDANADLGMTAIVDVVH